MIEQAAGGRKAAKPASAVRGAGGAPRAGGGHAQANPPPPPPVGLPAAHPQHAPVLGHRDGVGLDVLDAAPRELEILQLLRGGLLLGHDRKGNVLGGQVVRALLQPPARDLAQLAAAGGAGLGLQDAQRLGLALTVKGRSSVGWDWRGRGASAGGAPLARARLAGFALACAFRGVREVAAANPRGLRCCTVWGPADCGAGGGRAFAPAAPAPARPPSRRPRAAALWRAPQGRTPAPGAPPPTLSTSSPSGVYSGAMTIS